jgi:undecaprenyl phosphate-alpha-L-ara4FN deformylase
VRRTSVISHYGFKTLCYGVVLPGPDIAAQGRDVMKSVRDAGFEIGVHCYDHVLWQDNVANRNLEWTRNQMALAIEAFRRVFEEAPKVHGAAGWQMNEFVPSLEREFGFEYASDTRGTRPFFPATATGRPVCIQLPTTLPTFDELLGTEGCTAENIDEALFRRTIASAQSDHVFTLHAELEGMRLKESFARLLSRWRAAGFELCSMRAFFEGLALETVPLGAIVYESIEGRSGLLATESPLATSQGISP